MIVTITIWPVLDDKTSYPPPPVPFDLQSSRTPSLYDPPPSMPQPQPAQVGASEDRNSSHPSSSVSGGSRRTTGTTLSVANPTDEEPIPAVPRSKAEEAGLVSSSSDPTYYHDSGIRFGSAGEPSGSGAPLTDVPPSYSEA